MSPSLHRGDVVILRNTEPDDVTVGSIIQYRVGEFSIIHRVVEMTEAPSGSRFYVTRGDANTSTDPNPVTYGQIAGKHVFTLPKVGWIGIMATRAFGSVAGFF